MTRCGGLAALKGAGPNARSADRSFKQKPLTLLIPRPANTPCAFIDATGEHASRLNPVIASEAKQSRRNNARSSVWKLLDRHAAVPPLAMTRFGRSGDRSFKRKPLRLCLSLDRRDRDRSVQPGCHLSVHGLGRRQPETSGVPLRPPARPPWQHVPHPSRY